MPSSRERSAEILQQALNSWSLYTRTYERYALLNECLAGSSPEINNFFLGSLERYIQEERVRMLDSFWGGISNGTPAQAEYVTVPPETMARVQKVVAFYGVNRCFLFLYVHAYLWDKVMKIGPLSVLDMMIDELDPR